MATFRQAKKLWRGIATVGLLLLAALVLAAVAAGGSPPKPPWADPANYTLKLPVKTQVGPVCAAGDKSGKTCRYVPLGGTLITVKLPSGKVFSVSHTAANGRGFARLPKGSATVTFSHGPWRGHPLGGNTIKVKGPTYMPPPNYYLFTFCLVAGC